MFWKCQFIIFIMRLNWWQYSVEDILSILSSPQKKRIRSIKFSTKILVNESFGSCGTRITLQRRKECHLLRIKVYNILILLYQIKHNIYNADMIFYQKLSIVNINLHLFKIIFTKLQRNITWLT